MGYFKLLSAADLDQIHQTSMKVLEEVGIAFPSEEAQVIFKQHGVRVAAGHVYLTEAQVMLALHGIPKQFTLHARNPQRSVSIGNRKYSLRPGLRRAIPGGCRSGQTLRDAG